MSRDIKLSEAQISKMIQSGRSFSSWLDNLNETKILTDVAIPLTRDNLPALESSITSNTKKMIIIISGQEAVQTGKIFTLFISNEYMNNIIRNIKQ